MFENKMSEKFMIKFLGDTFKPVSDKNWIAKVYYHMIDSKYGTMKKIDLFLKHQVDNPHPDLVDVAAYLRKKSKTPDELIINTLNYVWKRVTYVPDQKQWNYIEKWSMAYDTWLSKRGDCEDMNSLIYVLARLAGLSDMALWSVIGKTSPGGHYWNLYFSPRKASWYAIDGAYYVDMKPIDIRNPFTFRKTQYQKIWYMFNEQSIFK